MTQHNDFFFQGIINGSPSNSVALADLQKKVFGAPKEFLSQQFDRLLGQIGGELTIWTEGSAPEFYQFLESVDPSWIGKVVIFAVPKDNDHVKATLSCELYFPHGIITFTADWCAYKTLRAQEVVHTLLVPIHQFGLGDRTLLRQPDGALYRLHTSYDTHHEHEVKEVFKLAQHRSALQVGEEDRLKFQTLLDDLTQAHSEGHRKPKREQDLEWALSAALKWIDAVPDDVELQAMPGFDRDYVDSLLGR